jgi:hypothetical protein
MKSGVAAVSATNRTDRPVGVSRPWKGRAMRGDDGVQQTQ